MKRNGLLARLALLLLAGAIAPGTAAPTAPRPDAVPLAHDPSRPLPAPPAALPRPPLAAARLGLQPAAASVTLSLQHLAPTPRDSLALVGMR